jgi:hypothetical protein
MKDGLALPAARRSGSQCPAATRAGHGRCWLSGRSAVVASPFRQAMMPVARHSTAWEHAMLKVALWIVVVIFIIGLLVVFGVLDLIF